ncbi:MAG: hypothetical protein DRP45_07105 [Candidatus Zixiibacteriota bacterium]|nr:MAG: hypothetical protein DRP45_07105 [candidate division Zixibacteria bacterium]
MSFLKGGLDLPDSGKGILPEEQEAVIVKLARKVVDKGMTVPAIMFLESVKPLNFIGSQVMVFFEPVVQAVFNISDYDNLRMALEKRETIEIMILRIEEMDVVAARREKIYKKWYKQEKKKWKWYQRYLGVFTPKMEVPEEVREELEDGG